MAKFALITGAADRIGKSFALALAKMDYNIFLHYNTSKEKAEDTATLIEKMGQTCILKQANFKKEEQVTQYIADCCHEGDLEILINNASNFIESNFETVGSTLLDDLYTVNFKAPYILTKQFASQCRKGLIINMLDTKIKQYKTKHLDYLLTKKSLEDFTYLSATHLAPDIRVNGIAPGLILPPEDKSDDYLEEMAKGIPLQKRGDLEHLVQALKLLVENPFITGEVITVDGGEHLNI
ncbi:SDR family NAD(P)-dependent oxidoreductase [Rhodohalobacter sp. 8-1]|uniref:SDR family NAD(P)-dependent oxidoreductase n=1 Tax=Rhodohalobacter sp. 8-1 TaxID=3131972 RepID=UPI0030EE2142